MGEDKYREGIVSMLYGNIFCYGFMLRNGKRITISEILRNPIDENSVGIRQPLFRRKTFRFQNNEDVS